MPRSPWTAGAGVYIGLTGLFVAGCAVGAGSPFLRSLLSCLFMLWVALHATATAVRTARAATGRRSRRGWWLLAGGCFAWSLTQAWWTFLEVADVDPPTLLGVTGFGYALLPILALPALWLLVHAPQARTSRRSRMLFALDVTALSGAVVLLGWQLALQRAFAQDAAFPVVFGIGDVLIAIAVVGLLAGQAGVIPRPVRLVAAGLVLIAATDITYVGQALDGQYVTGTPLDAGWVLGFLLLAAGARAGRVQESGDAMSRRSRRLQLMLPYVPVVLAVTASGYEVVQREEMHPIVVPLTLAVAVVASVRQWLTLTQNADLIDELEEREVDLRRRALQDPLTGLGNRTLLLDRLEAALAERDAPVATLLYIDLDDFKLINDTHGHDAGDQVLVQVAQRLAGLAGPRDTVARLGGDEFAVLVTDRDGEELAHEMLASLHQPLAVGARRFVVNGSVGVVRAEASDETAGTLLSHADIAMYAAKNAGKGRVAAVHGADRAEAVRKTRIRELIAHPCTDHFRVLYQPVVDLRDGQIRGLEALVRWSHPEVGEVSPVEFIHLAEQAGSIGVIGKHVLVTALRDLGEWQRTYPHRRLAVGVNVSPLQLCDDELLRTALTELAAQGLASDQLVLEITEEALVGDIDQAAVAVDALRAAGMSVAIDDFGTGYSSFRYLDRFQADVLKVERSFVAKMAGNARTRELVRSVVGLGHVLDLQTIAEGVETIADLQMLRGMGCELAQGFLFARPQPKADIDALLAAGGCFPLDAPVPAPRTGEPVALVRRLA